jgi:3-hydroxybutyryl-CoA dehydrogenase
VSQPNTDKALGIAGSGAIACGLARLAGPVLPTTVWARSEASAERARAQVDGSAQVSTDLDDLARCSVVVEAVAEDSTVKGDLLGRLGGLLADNALLATTTSSLSISALARASGRPDRFCGLHVFNPVEKMKLVELAFPAGAAAATRTGFTELCEELGKTAVEVPDVPGFVVNRLLFPYLFAAVAVADEHGLEPSEVDACMKLGAGHPMGPLEVLDFVGLDVAAAIGESIGADVPRRLTDLIGQGRLGRKSGAGFHDYD